MDLKKPPSTANIIGTYNRMKIVPEIKFSVTTKSDLTFNVLCYSDLFCCLLYDLCEWFRSITKTMNEKCFWNRVHCYFTIFLMNSSKNTLSHINLFTWAMPYRFEKPTKMKTNNHNKVWKLIFRLSFEYQQATHIQKMLLLLQVARIFLRKMK